MNETRESEDFARVGLFLSTGGILYPSLYSPRRTTSSNFAVKMTIGMGLFAATAGGASALRNAGSVAAIVGASVAVLLLVTGVVKWWLRRRARAKFGDFLYEGNELQVRLTETGPNDESLPGLLAEMDAWFAKVERFVEKQNRALVSVLRSDSGIATPPGHDVRSYRVVWLPQRIKQMEKIFGQL